MRARTYILQAHPSPGLSMLLRGVFDQRFGCNLRKSSQNGAEPSKQTSMVTPEKSSSYQKNFSLPCADQLMFGDDHGLSIGQALLGQKVCIFRDLFLLLKSSRAFCSTKDSGQWVIESICEVRCYVCNTARECSNGDTN